MNKSRTVSKIIIGAIFFALTLTLLAVVDFQLFLGILKIFWWLILLATTVFIILGVLTFIGKKKEAEELLNLFLEGTLSLIDLAKFIKGLFNLFKQTVLDAILKIIPYLSIVVALALYLVVLVFYKYVGTRSDVTIVTIAVTVVLTVTAGVLTLPATLDGRKKPPESPFLISVANFRKKFIDSFEIMILVLFLTIDSTKLYFLPKELNVPIRSNIGEYNLMYRGIMLTDHGKITLTLFIVAVALELLRVVTRLLSVAKKLYDVPRLMEHDEGADLPRGAERLKAVLRKTVNESKDDLLMFAAFTVFITLVFMFFPRLKLVALITASATSFVLDVTIRWGKVLQKQEDLLSRVFQRLVRS